MQSVSLASTCMELKGLSLSFRKYSDTSQNTENQCVDVDECINAATLCPSNTVCNNTIGQGYSFTNTSWVSSVERPFRDHQLHASNHASFLYR